MCGRYSLRADPDAIASHFDLDRPPDWAPRFNIAPTQPAGVVRCDPAGQRQWALLRWGLVPSDAADPAVGVRMINARRETVARKASFRGPYRRQRCLVPADGFYEWTGGRGRRQPIHFRRPDQGLFAFAGLWDAWTGRDGDSLETFTILTTEPNALVAPVHNRMPVILAPAQYGRWLDPGTAEQDLAPLTDPPAAADFEAVEVNPAMNRVEFDGPECLAPPPPPIELDLFD